MRNFRELNLFNCLILLVHTRMYVSYGVNLFFGRFKNDIFMVCIKRKKIVKNGLIIKIWSRYRIDEVINHSKIVDDDVHGQKLIRTTIVGEMYTTRLRIG